MAFVSAQKTLADIKKTFRATASGIALIAAMGFSPATAQAQIHTCQPFIELGYVTAAGSENAPVEMPTAITEETPLYTAFSRTQLGRDLLAYAREEKVAIYYDPDLAKNENCGEYNHLLNKILIRTNMSMDDQIITLAHEIWHAWQDRNTDYYGLGELLMTPQERWTLRRYIEADAFSFSSYFMADYVTNTGQEKIDAPLSQNEAAIAGRLKLEFNSPDGMTLSEYRVISFEYFMQQLSIYDYNAAHLLRNETIANRLEARAGAVARDIEVGNYIPAAKELQKLRREAIILPGRVAFEKNLRKFGGLECVPQAKTCLNDKRVTSVTLLEDYPFRFVANGNNPAETYVSDLCDAFDKSAAKYDEIKEKIRQLDTKLKEAKKRPKSLKH